MLDSKSFETVMLCFLFIFNIAGIGFLIAIIVNAIRLYINSSSAVTYSYFIQTELFAPQQFPDYFLTAVVFAGLGLVIIYAWKQNRSLKKMIFRD